MTYAERRAVEHAADLAKPFLHFQDWSKDHKYRPLLLEPVIDRDKALKKAELVKKIRTCSDTGWLELPYDVGDDENRDPSAAPKQATHAGYLNSLVYRLQKTPEDKEALSVLLYTVYADSALEQFAGKFVGGQAGGLTVDESWTAEDLAKVIADTKRLAALPQHNVPDDGWCIKLTHPEPAAQEPPLHFHGPAEYLAWAATATQEQIDAYCNALSDFKFQLLCDDIDDYERYGSEPAMEAAYAAQEPTPEPEWCYEPLDDCDYTTHAELINALLDILAAHPEDTDVQDHLSYEVSNSTYPTGTPEAVEDLIKAAHKVAEDPLSKVPHANETPYIDYASSAERIARLEAAYPDEAWTLDGDGWHNSGPKRSEDITCNTAAQEPDATKPE